MKKTTMDPSSLLRRTMSTMPRQISAAQTGAPGPDQSAAGSPKEGVEKLTATLQGAEAQDLHLLRDVPDSQLSEDRAQSFDGADRYVRRVAEAMILAITYLSGFFWKPEDLLKRLLRIEALDTLIETTEGMLVLLKNTRAVEMADLLRMCDLVVAELQALVDRPLLNGGTRGKLLQILRGPLSVWEKRLERIRKTKDDFAGLRAQLTEAQATAARPAAPTPAPAAASQPQPLPAPRAGRRAPR